MLKYIEFNNPKDCCGCGVCISICPTNALKMGKNEEGFLYPVLSKDKCINCDLCQKTCPVENVPLGEKPLNQYAMQLNDSDVLKKSSSGGVFRLLADTVIMKNGCVVGCVWDKNYKPIFTIAEKIEDLYPMQGSKYLYSNMDGLYIEIQQKLKEGSLVLFSGAPCQCAGLKNFLRREYDNLITIDFICHGMPSQTVFDHYLNSLKKKYSGEIEEFKFRDKTLRGWGMVSSFVVNGKAHHYVGNTSPYIFGFTSGYFNRYSCYECPFRGKKRFTDFTMCDYWGIQNFHPEFDISLGVSAITVNTIKANAIWYECTEHIKKTPTKLEFIAGDNPSILYEEKEKIPDIRKSIYKKIDSDGWNSVAKKYLRCPKYFMRRIWYSIPWSVVKLIKGIK